MNLQGGFFDYFVVFWAGVLVSFSPCVYPVLPVIVSFIGGVNPEGKRLRGLVLSLIYVLGMSITYSTFGIIAALSGSMFGQMQNQPVFYLIASVALLIFGLAMMGVIRIPAIGIDLRNKLKLGDATSMPTCTGAECSNSQAELGNSHSTPLPSGLQSATCQIQHRVPFMKFFIVFLFGMASGIVVGPCTVPILGTLLLYVQSRQNLPHAISLMFVFSYGVGASVILLGTFTGLLSSMPKAGKWMVIIQRVFGLILMVIAGYFLFLAVRMML